MNTLKSFIKGKWTSGSGDGKELLDAVTGDPIAIASSEGFDFEDIFEYGRKTGTHKLSQMTFHERGRMIKALALYLNSKKEKFYELSYRTGATKADSWIDIDGGIGNLFAYSSLRKQFPNETYYIDGDPAKLSKNGTFIGHHILVPKEGVAIHINAFNFPVWGMLEKTAVNWMAGVAAVVKPATVTSFLTQAVVEEIVASGILPEGALQLICGSARGMLDYADSQDVVTFTGSASTGRMLKSNKRIIEEAVPFNMEADSLNAAVLGEDAVPGTPEFDLFIKEVRKEMTVKCGQKCTAIRRVIVPEKLVEDVHLALASQLQKTVIGDPHLEDVRMGALVGREQMEEVKQQIRKLTSEAQILFGDLDKVEVKGADSGKGAFLSPMLLLNNDPLKSNNVHEVEAFGPVSSILPYKDLDDAIALTKKGKGSLVCSIATHDNAIARKFVLGSASHHGRILMLNRDWPKRARAMVHQCRF